MLVHNKGNYTRVANGVTVIPGANHLSDEEFQAFMKHPISKKLIEIGEISVPAGQAPSISELNADEAIALIKDTHSVEFLQQFKEGETRKTVLAAIEEQLATLQQQ